MDPAVLAHTHFSVHAHKGREEIELEMRAHSKSAECDYRKDGRDGIILNPDT